MGIGIKSVAGIDQFPHTATHLVEEGDCNLFAAAPDVGSEYMHLSLKRACYSLETVHWLLKGIWL